MIAGKRKAGVVVRRTVDAATRLPLRIRLVFDLGRLAGGE
jgi:hypothetical protein